MQAVSPIRRHARFNRVTPSVDGCCILLTCGAAYILRPRSQSAPLNTGMSTAMSSLILSLVKLVGFTLRFTGQVMAWSSHTSVKVDTHLTS